MINPLDWNMAQWFMALQVFLGIGGAVGFVVAKQPVTGFIWSLYSGANFGWFLIAGGYK